MMGGAI